MYSGVALISSAFWPNLVIKLDCQTVTISKHMYPMLKILFHIEVSYDVATTLLCAIACNSRAVEVQDNLSSLSDFSYLCSFAMAYLSVAVNIQVISTWDSLVYQVPKTFVCRINAAEIPHLCERHDHKQKYTINKQLKVKCG